MFTFQKYFLILLHLKIYFYLNLLMKIFYKSNIFDLAHPIYNHFDHLNFKIIINLLENYFLTCTIYSFIRWKCSNYCWFLLFITNRSLNNLYKNNHCIMFTYTGQFSGHHGFSTWSLKIRIKKKFFRMK